MECIGYICAGIALTSFGVEQTTLNKSVEDLATIIALAFGAVALAFLG